MCGCTDHIFGKERAKPMSKPEQDNKIYQETQEPSRKIDGSEISEVEQWFEGPGSIASLHRSPYRDRFWGMVEGLKTVLGATARSEGLSLQSHLAQRST